MGYKITSKLIALDFSLRLITCLCAHDLLIIPHLMHPKVQCFVTYPSITIILKDCSLYSVADSFTSSVIIIRRTKMKLKVRKNTIL